jgi:hypothetical protein
MEEIQANSGHDASEERQKNARRDDQAGGKTWAIARPGRSRDGGYHFFIFRM